MDARLKKMAEIIIQYSTKVKPGELVLIRSTSPAAQPFVQALYQESLRAGGKTYTYMHLSQENSLAAEATDDIALLSEPNPMLKLMYETCDVIIRIESEENTVEMSEYAGDKKAARIAVYNHPLRIQTVREADGSLRRCTAQYPTQGYAQAAGMSLLQYEEFFYKACKLHYDDPLAAWRETEVMQDRLIDFLKNKDTLVVRGPNVDLELSIKGRIFENACGTSNFPDGEIFTGPVETSVNGWVQFTYPARYQGNEVLGARLEFKDGLVVKATAEKNAEFLNQMLDTDDGSRRLGEFAIGTNRDVQRFTGSILFDEKIGGTIHMALGSGYPTTGSLNKSSIHWDMICDMREGEILADGQPFYKNGDFVI